ncbi:hypothetical protein [Streptomyces sp. NPDC018352]|uniref:hypothetical protein n=1 Tax=Streptomyces sp. NPDC018352 TaxID=3157194 RepID=UPI003406DFBE
MMLIGIDPHESTDTATAVDPETNRDLASIRTNVTLQEYQRMLDWACRGSSGDGPSRTAGAWDAI